MSALLQYFNVLPNPDHLSYIINLSKKLTQTKE